MSQKRIAVIGAGISGLSAAWALRQTADVTVYEARDRIGGHSHTMSLDYDGTNVDVDVGFIVYNALNYPNLIAMFDALDVETIPSDMSFAVSDPNGWEWASNARGLFAQKRNLLSPRFHRFWRTILKFNNTAREELAAGNVTDITLGEWLAQHNYDDDFLNNSTPEQEMLNYPAISFFNFFENHKLMHKERPKWRTVKGGSKNYVNKLVAILGNRIRPGTAAKEVVPSGDQVQAVTKSKSCLRAERCVSSTMSLWRVTQINLQRSSTHPIQIFDLNCEASVTGPMTSTFTGTRL